MSDFLVTDIDDALWERFKAKAAAAGKSEEQLALELINAYLLDHEPEMPAASAVDSAESPTTA